MGNTPLILELPSELLERASTAHLDLRQLMIDALETKLEAEAKLQLSDHEIEQILRLRLPAEKVPEALDAIRRGERVFNLPQGMIWISDDFDDELPDDFWLGSDA